MKPARMFIALISGLVALTLHADAADRVTLPDLPRMMRDIRILSHPDFAGRQTGSEGGRRSAEYVAERFEQLSLTPAGQERIGTQRMAWGQTGPVTVTQFEAPATLEFSFSGEPAPDTIVPQLGSQFLPVLDSPSVNLTAPLVFVGYGIADPARGWDEYEGVAVRNRVVMFLRGKPSHYPLHVHHAEKERIAREKRRCGFRHLHRAGIESIRRTPWHGTPAIGVLHECRGRPAVTRGLDQRRDRSGHVRRASLVGHGYPNQLERGSHGPIENAQQPGPLSMEGSAAGGVAGERVGRDSRPRSGPERRRCDSRSASRSFRQPGGTALSRRRRQRVGDGRVVGTRAYSEERSVAQANDSVRIIQRGRTKPAGINLVRLASHASLGEHRRHDQRGSRGLGQWRTHRRGCQHVEGGCRPRG